jgi:hypothetical protein
VGFPALDAYFNRLTVADSDYLFDSITLPGPFLPTGAPLDSTDADRLFTWARDIFEPESVVRYAEHILRTV